MTNEGGTLNLWLLVYPAPDAPGEWVSHCLDVDIVMKGTSLQDAVTIIRDLLLDLALHDLEAGRDLFEGRKRAPLEAWEALHELQRDGTVGLLPPSFETMSSVMAAALQLRLVISRGEVTGKADLLRITWFLPSASSGEIELQRAPRWVWPQGIS